MLKLTSINSRIIFGAIAVVSSFMLLTGFTLSKTFYNSAYSALEDRMTGQVYLLMAVRDFSPRSDSSPALNVQIEKPLPGRSAYSQLSGFITQADGVVLWQSAPNIEASIPPSRPLKNGRNDHGKKIFQKYNVDGHTYIGLSITIFWDLKNPGFPLIYHISDDLTDLDNKISDYQYSLWGNLILMSLFLFIMLFLILRWGLKPLRDVEQEIKAVEQGEQEQLKNDYPDEITPLTQNLNQLIQYERQQQLRYRNALADLAHSLKTPLAIIRGQDFNKNQSSNTQEQTFKNINNAVDRMNSIIEYQLQRAGSNSPSPHIQYLQLEPVIQTLIDSMKKIYRDKSIHYNYAIEPGIQFKIDEGDFMEILGNLLDNACKWCHNKIKLNMSLKKTELHIQVSDDGPGIAPEMLNEITKRGVRNDELTPGHGVGLAIVKDIVSVYNGKINFTSTSTGGLEVNIYFQT